ncbi:MAG: tetratricopeptide repeat protein [Candidatus Omnitrophota bacterium]|jgi:tetratricopeptide (TPR) repeat protein
MRLKPEQKEYILENINKKSIQKISQVLNLKERKIKKFLQKYRIDKRQISPQTKIGNSTNKRSLFVSAVLIIILGLAVYANSLNGKFVWDDDVLIRDNVYIKNWSHIHDIVTKDIGAGAGRQYNSYRPLQILTYAIDHSLWGLNVKGYHLTNILLHILAALSIYWLINLLYGDRLLSLLISVFFVIYPLHTEAIAYISGRADPLVLFLMLACFILYIKHSYSKNIILYLLMLLSFTLALLSKENSLILPVLLLLYHHAFRKKLEVLSFLSIASIGLVYIVLRSTVLNFLLPNMSCPSALFERMPGFLVAIANYARLIFLPFNLHMEYGNKLFKWTDPRAILGMIILFSLLICAFRKRKTNQLVFFSISWMFITLMPQSNLLPINAYMAEHWLYLPSIGFFILLAKGLIYIYQTKRLRILAIVLIAGLCTFYSYLTIRQNVYWREPIVFYERTLKYAPDSPKIHNDLGNIYSTTDKKQKAIASYKKAIELNPAFTNAYYNLGFIYHTLSRKQEAIDLYNKTIAIDPNYAQAYYGLGYIYAADNKNKEAIAMYKKAIEIYPEYANAYNNLGLIYNTLNQKQEAIDLYQKAIKFNPGYAEAYNNLAAAYYDIGNPQEAIALLKRAIDNNPNYALLYHNLAKMYAITGNDDLAIRMYKQATAIDPDNSAIYERELAALYNKVLEKDGFESDKQPQKTQAESFFQAGVGYGMQGKHREAIAEFKKAIEADPDFIGAYINLGNAYMQQESIDQAVEVYKKAIQIDPGINSSLAYLNLGAIYTNIKKDYDQAVEYLQKYVELNPDTQESKAIQERIHQLIYYILQNQGNKPAVED